MNAPRPPLPSDAEVLHHVTSEPQIVIRIATQVGADVFDVERILRELAERGAVVRHPGGIGIPVMWSAAR